MNPANATDHWGELLLALDERRHLPPSSRHNGQVVLERTWREDLQKACAVWTKQYNLKPSASVVSLEASKNWETVLLHAVGRKSLQYCSAPYNLNQKGTSLKEVVIETLNAGLSLDYWQRMRPYTADGTARSSPFFSPAAFLRLTHGLLQAFREFHEAGFVHCDFREDNVCMPLLQPVTATGHTEVQVSPDWDGIKLIDFGFSVCRFYTPDTLLPHQPKDSSAHFLGVVERLGEFACEHEHGRGNDLFSMAWWATNNRREMLKLFTLLDWREDIHACGKMLQRIRGGVSLDLTQSEAMRGLVETLPEEMLKISGLGPSPVELFDRENPPPAKPWSWLLPQKRRDSWDIPPMPHATWMRQIEAALALAGEDETQMLAGFTLKAERYPEDGGLGLVDGLESTKPIHDLLPMSPANPRNTSASPHASPSIPQASAEATQTRCFKPPLGKSLAAAMVAACGFGLFAGYQQWQRTDAELAARQAEYGRLKPAVAAWYRLGSGPLPTDFARWRELGLKLAAQGNIEAVLDQAMLEWYGAGIPQDRTAALRRLHKHRAALDLLAKDRSSPWQSAARDALEKLRSSQ